MSNVYIAKELKADWAAQGTPDSTRISNRCRVGAGTAGWAYRSFLQHDFSGIPIGSTIISAKLYWYPYSANSSYQNGGFKFDVVCSEWEEGTVSWNNQPDILSIPIPSQWLVPTVNAWNSWDITKFVQRWVSQGLSNNGIAFVNKTESSGATDWDFYTRRQGDGEYATYIEVEYEPVENWLITSERMVELADEVRRITGTTDKLDIEQIITALQGVDTQTT